MGLAILTIIDAAVSKGYEKKPQATFTPNEGNAKYGTCRFRVGLRRQKGEEVIYDNYTVEWNGAPAGILDILNTPGVRVGFSGQQTQEEYNKNSFLRVRLDGAQALTVVKYGEKGEVAPVRAAAPVTHDEL